MIYNNGVMFMNASFTKRLIAYLIDMFIVSLICSIITINVSSNNTNKYNKELNNLMNDYVNKKVEVNDYIDKYQNIVYNMEKSNMVINSVYLFANIFYFVIFQFMNNGQSIGKKLMHIRICDKDKFKLSIFSMIMRALIINNILSGSVALILLIIGNKKVFFVGYSVVNGISNIFIIISVLMLLYGKEKLALHDIISRSVVKEEDVNYGKS